jgi:hypothetical protein
MKKFLIPALVAASFLIASTADAAAPKRPNLQAAHQLVLKAMAKIDAAQKNSEDKLGGHGQKALDLLKQAEDQLNQALNTVNAESPNSK